MPANSECRASRNTSPRRLDEELPDLVFYTVNSTAVPPRLTVQSDGTRLSSAYGNTGKGRYLDEFLGSRLAPLVMPVYYQAVQRGLPVYTISNIDDIYGQIVAYERLLLPFSGGGGVTHMIASLKTISEDGGFEIRNLMRGNDTLPTAKLRAVIDRDLFHRAPAAFRPATSSNSVSKWNSRAPIPRWSDPSSSAICSMRGCARPANYGPCLRWRIINPTGSPTSSLT